MPRILGIDIPNNKPTVYALTALFGIGMHRSRIVCEQCQVEPTKRAFQLTEDEVGRITACIDGNFTVEGDLRREIAANIQRFKDIGCWRGQRHIRGLPVRGQRTRTNARTRKGKKKTVANKKILRK